MAAAEHAQTPSAEVARFLEAHHIRTVRVEWYDLHGVARGKRARAEYFLRAGDRGFPFSSAAVEMDLRGEIPGVSDQDPRWPNLYACPDLNTLRLVPTEPDTAAVICDLFHDDGTPVALSPRQVLRRVLGEAARRGYRPDIGPELEFYLFQDAHLTLLPPGKLAYRVRNSLQEQQLLEALQADLAAAGVAFESMHAEDGPGQFEVILGHGPALAAADAVCVARDVLRERARRLGLVATFLPKPLPNESGSGFHIHQGLLDAGSGDALFTALPDRSHPCPAMEQYLAGQLTYTPEIAALLLPTVNAYKRARARRTRIRWGVDDRSAAFRVLRRAHGYSVEHRVAGGDANPYLYFAAALAAGLEGMDRSLGLPEETPDPPSLPRDLDAALDLLEDSALARHWLGDDLVDRFVTLKRDEAERYALALTDWEREEYLEYL